MSKTILRCPWCGKDPLYVAYHDNEWGVPVHDDKTLFEFIILEGAQAGLSWITILRKRENYRKALDNFDVHIISQYNDADVTRLMNDAGIVRNKLKVESCIKNAKGALKIIEEFGSLHTYFWSFVNGSSIKNHPETMSDIPVRSDISDALSKDLKKRGFNFVGSTIMYAFMQAVGMVDDHIKSCHKY